MGEVALWYRPRVIATDASPRPRLLYVANDAPFFQAHFGLLASRAADAGYEVHVAAGGEVGDVGGAAFHRLALSRKGVHPLTEARTVLDLHALLRRLRPEIAHFITIKPVVYGGILSRVLGIPAVTHTIPGLGYVFLAGGAASVLRAGVRLGYKLALAHPNSATIFQNPDDRAEFVQRRIASQAATFVIKGSGVDMSPFRPDASRDAPPIVALPARMLWDKGIGEFVRAAGLLRRRGVVARFALIGGLDAGNPSAIGERELRDWNASGDVEWWGFRSDMPEVFARSSIACLPSYREGVPRALIEAAASGLPIVATDAPGCREVVQHEHNGLLVPVKDAVALAEALERLLANPSERARMGANSRQLAAREFSPDAVIGETLAVYEQLREQRRTVVSAAFS